MSKEEIATDTVRIISDIYIYIYMLTSSEYIY